MAAHDNMRATKSSDIENRKDIRIRRVLRDAELALSANTSRLSARTKIDGRTGGSHQARGFGAGSENSDARPYTPGDDPRRIDWNATARLNELTVRDTVAERALRVVLIVDGSLSMFHGTFYATKNELAVGAVALVAKTATRQGDLTAGYYGGAKPVWIPGGGGNRHVWTNVRAATAMTPGEQPFPTTLEQAAKLIGSTRSTVVILSDFHDATTLTKPIRRLAGTHTVLCLRIEDRSERTLPDVGIIQLAGTERRTRGQFDSTNSKLREMYTERATALCAERENVLRKAGAQTGTVRCGPLWGRDLVATLNRWT